MGGCFSVGLLGFIPRGRVAGDYLLQSGSGGWLSGGISAAVEKYYILYRGSTLTQIALPTALDLGTAGEVASDLPLSGVIITVDGAEQTLRAVTDVECRFTLQPAAVGRLFVHIDGQHAVGSSWLGGVNIL